MHLGLEEGGSNGRRVTPRSDPGGIRAHSTGKGSNKGKEGGGEDAGAGGEAPAAAGGRAQHGQALERQLWAEGLGAWWKLVGVTHYAELQQSWMRPGATWAETLLQRQAAEKRRLKAGTDRARAATAADNKLAARQMAKEAKEAEGRNAVKLLGMDLGRSGRWATVLTDSANVEGWSQGTRSWGQKRRDAARPMGRVAIAMQTLWAEGEQPLGGTFLAWIPRELNEAADFLTHVARRQPCRNRGWLAPQPILERARKAPLVAWVDAGESEEGVGLGVALANANSREVLLWAALWSPASGDINEEEARASEWALGAIRSVRRGEAQRLKQEWTNEINPRDRKQATKSLVWPGQAM